ncbi:hypothetical protein DES53_11115 [Roseimicrobium gellanilyticum]|uniref:Uncharacterized protein n=1 Tax=Roseimicrobium gellanilyticum TaxID=748857 RepID=A0A366H8F2_9BACT|nr:hypothetical protein DES53_11115 [Roseimicrobium gellanilyticum]
MRRRELEACLDHQTRLKSLRHMSRPHLAITVMGAGIARLNCGNV